MKFGTTCWNGLFVHLVEPGTPIFDPSGRRPPIIVNEATVAVVGSRLFCTKATEDKLAAKIEELRTP